MRQPTPAQHRSGSTSDTSEPGSDRSQAPDVVVLDDDEQRRYALRTVLELAGHVVAGAPVRMVGSMPGAVTGPLVLVVFPDDGRTATDAVADLRRRGRTGPVVALTAGPTSLPPDVDEHLLLPAALDEVIACARRHAPPSDVGIDDRRVVRVGNLVLDVVDGVASWAGAPLSLTTTEFRLLEHLVRHRDVVVEVGQLLDVVWGDAGLHSSNTVQVVVSSVRRKLRAAGCDGAVRTVRGRGYVLESRATR